jgi:hypothetical protein
MTKKTPLCAPGASSVSSTSLIRDSGPDASQTLAAGIEPGAVSPTCPGGAGAQMTRRTLMNTLVALPLVASPVSPPLPPSAKCARWAFAVS